MRVFGGCRLSAVTASPHHDPEQAACSITFMWDELNVYGVERLAEFVCFPLDHVEWDLIGYLEETAWIIVVQPLCGYLPLLDEDIKRAIDIAAPVGAEMFAWFCW